MVEVSIYIGNINITIHICSDMCGKFKQINLNTYIMSTNSMFPKLVRITTVTYYNS
jgi:hypothetical protein